MRLFGTGATSVATASVVAVVLLLGAGQAYRVLAPEWRIDPSARIKLPVPLAEIPWQIGLWAGVDTPIDPSIVEYMKRNFADDYVSRRYENSAEQLWATAYVVYCSTRPAGILGHKPQVCYPGNGWIWDATNPSRFTTRSGKVIECMIHQFHMPELTYREICVLNFYVHSGRVTPHEEEFSGVWDRILNFGRDPGRYVAQIQISSDSEHAVRTLASQMGDIILRFLPDSQGRVKAAWMEEGPIPAGGAADSDR